MSNSAEKATVPGGRVEPMVMPYSVDDRGNVADFYRIDESGEYHRVARLDREAGPEPNVDDVYTWDGDADVTEWAMQNGYRWDIRLANLLSELQRDRKRLCEMVGAAYTEGWMDGYAACPDVAEIEEDKDFHCGEDWLERDLRRELLEIMDRA